MCLYVREREVEGGFERKQVFFSTPAAPMDMNDEGTTSLGKQFILPTFPLDALHCFVVFLRRTRASSQNVGKITFSPGAYKQ